MTLLRFPYVAAVKEQVHDLPGPLEVVEIGDGLVEEAVPEMQIEYIVGGCVFEEVR